jgi:hypothetical protein
MQKQITIGSEQVTLVSDDGVLWFSSGKLKQAYLSRRAKEGAELKSELQSWFELHTLECASL